MDAGGAYINTTPTEIDFTPTSTQAGPPTTVVISPYNFETTGSFALTYATAGNWHAPAGEHGGAEDHRHS